MHRERLMEANIEDKEREEEKPAAKSDCCEVRVDIAADETTTSQPVVVTPPPPQKTKVHHYVLRRVPRWVREDNEHAYAPKFICIGPYHSGGGTAGHCLCRKELKQRYADELLEDAGALDKAGREQFTRICYQELREMNDYIRQFYGGAIQEMSTEDVVEMMFLDGCFIIKHLYNYACGSEDKELYQSTWAPAQLRNDLCLLENQVPFAVLAALFQHLEPLDLKLLDADEAKKRGRLLNMALWYMLNGWWSPPRKKPTDELRMNTDTLRIDHLLHLLHEAHRHQHAVAQEEPSPSSEEEGGRRRSLALAPPSGGGCPISLMRVLRCLCLCHWEPWPKDEPNSRENIPSAAELRALGIRIVKVEPERGGLLDVRFCRGSVTLEIPSLYIEQTTAPLLQNLVAYEQQLGAGGERYPRDYFTTYAFLMYNLVSTREDITLLQELRILHNNFGSDVKIIDYFKNLCMFNRRSASTPIDDVLRDLRKCKQQKVYRDWAEMKNYINSPVKVLLLIISAMVSLSTVMQALVAVRPI